MKRYLFYIAFLFSFSSIIGANPDTIVLVKKTSAWQYPIPLGGVAECNLLAEYPVSGGDPFQKAFNEWILSVSELDLITGNSFFSNLEEAYLQSVMSDVVKVSSIKGKQKLHPFNLALDMELRCLYENDKLITFKFSSIRYNIESERKELVNECSFIKSTGRHLQWSDVVLPKRQLQFNKVLVSVLQSFFGVTDFENLKGRLMNGEKLSLSSFPMPQEGPAFEKVGIRINYAPGEIADVSLGRPTALIPYSSVSSYLSSTVKKLLR